MSVFLSNQINFCQAGIYILENIADIYERCANNIINDPTRLGFTFNLIEVRVRNTVTNQPEELVIYRNVFPKKAVRPPAILDLLSSLPKEFKNPDFVEIFNSFYLEVMGLEMVYTMLVEEQGDIFALVPISGRTPIIKKILTNIVLNACDYLDIEGFVRLRLFPVFSKTTPNVIRMTTIEEGKVLRLNSNTSLSIRTKLKSLATVSALSIEEPVLQ